MQYAFAVVTDDTNRDTVSLTGLYNILGELQIQVNDHSKAGSYKVLIHSTLSSVTYTKEFTLTITSACEAATLSVSPSEIDTQIFYLGDPNHLSTSITFDAWTTTPTVCADNLTAYSLLDSGGGTLSPMIASMGTGRTITVQLSNLNNAGTHLITLKGEFVWG